MDNINSLYPMFRAETGSNLQISPELSHKDKIQAPLVFNQLNFMYQKLKSNKVPHGIEEMKAIIDNNVKDIEYYKG